MRSKKKEAGLWGSLSIIGERVTKFLEYLALEGKRHLSEELLRRREGYSVSEAKGARGNH